MPAGSRPGTVPRVATAACLLALLASLGYLARGTGLVSSAPRATAFLVTDTQTHYRSSTLRAQVRDRLAGQATVPAVEPIQPAITPVAHASTDLGATPPAARSSTPGSPDPANTSAPVEAVPSRSLVGCVLHLTGDMPPEFVDRATYQARPAYVFAVANEAWVVGIGCTAARPSIITAVRLGNAS